MTFLTIGLHALAYLFAGCVIGTVAFFIGRFSRGQEIDDWRDVARMGPPGACGQCGVDFDGTAIRHCVNGRLDCPCAIYAVEGVRTLDPHEGALLRKVLQFARDDEGITVDRLPLHGRTVGGAPTATFTPEDIVRLSILEDLNFQAELATQGVRI